MVRLGDIHILCFSRNLLCFKTQEMKQVCWSFAFTGFGIYWHFAAAAID